jgi:hypothetical protein
MLPDPRLKINNFISQFLCFALTELTHRLQLLLRGIKDLHDVAVSC